ncbi:hypothetical protein CSKR_102885 [Clonorchis sinensis]|uniref:Uncharacterized protein n=1 Tax=Clonorchis sinensis TaxID=79923 RepID=A0A3R7CIG1_CLOSI|nr:hypothetical protein CSKR_102885 [Clonorchis sinensis]
MSNNNADIVEIFGETDHLAKAESEGRTFAFEENVGSSVSVDGRRDIISALLGPTSDPSLGSTTLHNNELMVSPQLVMKLLAYFPWIYGCETTQWLERERTDRKVCDSNPTSASRLSLSRLEKPGSIPALVLPSGNLGARHQKVVTTERFQDFFISLSWSNLGNLETACLVNRMLTTVYSPPSREFAIKKA